jgi:tRNA(Ile)-lysidine synthase
LAWTDFEHRIWKKLKFFSLEKQNQFILAVSGGLDSIVLLKVMLELKPEAEFIVAHYHHGPSTDLQTVQFRDQALELVKNHIEKSSLKHKISLVSERSNIPLNSEDDFREKRRAFLFALKEKYPQAILVTGHHKDDLLETWLLKMLRGTGPHSLENFKFWNQIFLRPLLEFSKSELYDYAERNELIWLEDPSNGNSDYLRNWLRNDWLAALNKKLPSGKANLTDSLSRLIHEIDSNDEAIQITYEFDHDGKATKGWFNRADYLVLGHSERLKGLACVLKGLGHIDFSQGQLQEIIKRLDKNQKEHTFSVAGVNWFINAEQIMVCL